MLFQIIGRTNDTEKIVDEFFLLGVYDTFGGFSDFLRINYSVGDYIRRSKFIISSTYKAKLKDILKKFLAEEKEDKPDILDIVQTFCTSKAFEEAFESFAKEHIDVFEDSVNYSVHSNEHPLEFHAVYKKYLSKFESMIEHYIIEVRHHVNTLLYYN
ncbi:hypothetical protein EON65_24270 [archaeon]|nr:MAG: hypothetical protein EON65_24270 [archaeon]